MQGQKRVELDSMNIRDFKDKYVFLKDVFNKIKKNINIQQKQIKNVMFLLGGQIGTLIKIILF